MHVTYMFTASYIREKIVFVNISKIKRSRIKDGLQSNTSKSKNLKVWYLQNDNVTNNENVCVTCIFHNWTKYCTGLNTVKSI